MNLEKAEQIAKQRLEEHGLYEWSVCFKNMTSYCGQMVPANNKGRKAHIRLSKPFVELNPEEVIREVIDHEIAHILVRLAVLNNFKGLTWEKDLEGNPHGPLWKQIMQEMGYQKPRVSTPGRMK